MSTPCDLRDLRDLRGPLLAWSVAALVSIFLHGPLPLYSTRSLAVAWEMWDRGSWLVPLFNGAPYSHKTPLLPWLIHAGWLVTGVSDVWPRLLMVLLSAIVVAQVGLLARRLYPDKPDLPRLAAWAMAGFWYLFLFALQVMYELPLTVAVLGGLLALCRRDGAGWNPWWPGVALAVGFGLLAKGPVVLLHLGVPLLAARWWHLQVPALWRDSGNRFAWIWVLGVVLAFSAISGKNPYYLLPEFAGFAILLALAADARPRLGIATGVTVLAVAALMLGAHALAERIQQPFPDGLLTSLPLGGALLVLVGIGVLRWRTLPAQAGGLLLALVLVHAALTPLLKAQFDFTPTATLLGDAQRAGKRIAFLGEYQLQFHFAGRLRKPLEVVDEAGARAWAARHPDQLIVVNTREAWQAPGPQPVTQQRFRRRWIQVWRAGEWRALPAQQLPLQASAGQLRTQPR